MGDRPGSVGSQYEIVQQPSRDGARAARAPLEPRRVRALGRPARSDRAARGGAASPRTWRGASSWSLGESPRSRDDSSRGEASRSPHARSFAESWGLGRLRRDHAAAANRHRRHPPRARVTGRALTGRLSAAGRLIEAAVLSETKDAAAERGEKLTADPRLDGAIAPSPSVSDTRSTSPPASFDGAAEVARERSPRTPPRSGTAPRVEPPPLGEAWAPQSPEFPRRTCQNSPSSWSFLRARRRGRCRRCRTRDGAMEGVPADDRGRGNRPAGRGEPGGARGRSAVRGSSPKSPDDYVRG